MKPPREFSADKWRLNNSVTIRTLQARVVERCRERGGLAPLYGLSRTT
jgi:hypothetical protein